MIQKYEWYVYIDDNSSIAQCNCSSQHSRMHRLLWGITCKTFMKAFVRAEKLWKSPVQVKQMDVFVIYLFVYILKKNIGMTKFLTVYIQASLSLSFLFVLISVVKSSYAIHIYQTVSFFVRKSYAVRSQNGNMDIFFIKQYVTHSLIVDCFLFSSISLQSWSARTLSFLF